MNEFELKFQVPPDRVAGLERALRRGTTRRQRLAAVYYDTAGGDLAAQGVVLRIRHEEQAWVQTAKAPGHGGFDRIEHDVALPSRRGRPEPDLALHDGHPAGERIREALQGAANPVLRKVYETDVVRLSRTINAAGTLVEVAFDQGVIGAGARKAPVLELELERKQGSTRATVELAQRWCETHGLWLDPVAKSMIGQRLARGGGAPPAVTGRPGAGKKPRSASQLVADMLDSGIHQILGNARELAIGTGTDEHVHQMRIGLRRLRSVLRELRGIEQLADVDESVGAALAGAFRVLGRHRDLTQLVPALRAQLAQAGDPAGDWAPALPDIAAAVRAPELQAALLRVIACAARLREEPAGGELKDIRKLVAERLEDLRKEVARDGARFEELERTERHQVRKRLKRLRYLSELVRPIYRGSEVDAFVKALKTMQDALGAYQDAAAGRALYEEHAQVQPQAWFGAGWLAAAEERLARKCGKACKESMRRARRFWGR